MKGLILISFRIFLKISYHSKERNLLTFFFIKEPLSKNTGEKVLICSCPLQGITPLYYYHLNLKGNLACRSDETGFINREVQTSVQINVKSSYRPVGTGKTEGTCKPL